MSFLMNGLNDLCERFGRKSPSHRVLQLSQLTGISTPVSEIKEQLTKLSERWLYDGCDVIARLLVSTIHSMEKLVLYNQKHIMKRSDHQMDPFVLWSMISFLLAISDVPSSLSELLHYQDIFLKDRVHEPRIQPVKYELDSQEFSGLHWMTQLESEVESEEDQLVFESNSCKNPVISTLYSLNLSKTEKPMFLEMTILDRNPLTLIISEILDHMSGNPSWTFLHKLHDGLICLSPVVHLESHLNFTVIQRSLSCVFLILEQLDKIRDKQFIFERISTKFQYASIVSGLWHSVKYFLNQIIQCWITTCKLDSCNMTSFIAFSTHYTREWSNIVSWVYKIVTELCDNGLEHNITILSCIIYDLVYKNLNDYVQYSRSCISYIHKDTNMMKLASLMHELVIQPYNIKLYKWINHGILSESNDFEFPIFYDKSETSIKIRLKSNDQSSICISEFFASTKFFMPLIAVPEVYKLDLLPERLKRGWYLFTYVMQHSIKERAIIRSYHITIEQKRLLERILSLFLPIPSKFYDDLVELFRMDHSHIKNISHLAFCIQERLQTCPLSVTYTTIENLDKTIHSYLKHVFFEWSGCDKFVSWLLDPLKSYLQRICSEWICLLYLKCQLERAYFGDRKDRRYLNIMFLIRGIWHHVSSSLNQIFYNYNQKFVSCIFAMQNICFNFVSDCLSSMFFKNDKTSYDLLYFAHMEGITKVNIELDSIGKSLDCIRSIALNYLHSRVDDYEELFRQWSFLRSVLGDIYKRGSGNHKCKRPINATLFNLFCSC